MTALATAAIEVCQLRLELSDAELAGLDGCLSWDERARASSFRFERDRRRFVAARGQLRHELGARLGLAPAEVVFDYGRFGKPSVAGAEDIRFNLARSHGWALLAITHGAEVGVDLEVPRPGDDDEPVARSFFCAAESAALAACPERGRHAAFLRCWTRKEAYVKALGDGLQMPLDAFEVSLDSAPAPRLLWCRDAGEVERWHFTDLSTSRYTAALAVESSVEPAIRVRELGPRT